MKKLYIKQKIFSLNEKFSVFDANGNEEYFVEGSFMKLPKIFTIYNAQRKEIGQITKKTFSFLPKFFLRMNGEETTTITKMLTLFKAHYSIESEGISIDGDWLDMNFTISQQGKLVAAIKKSWISVGDTYELEILDETVEEKIVALVIMIDCVMEDESSL